MALSQRRLEGIKRGLEGLDRRLPMAPTMDGRLPLHQDCRELLAEVERRRTVSLYLVRGDTGSGGNPEESYREWDRVDIEFDGIRMSLEDYVQEVLPALKASDEDHPVLVRLTLEAADG